MKKTQAEIDREIELLEMVRPWVPPLSYFGNDNLSLVDVAIMVLRHGLSKKDIEKLWPEEPDEQTIKDIFDNEERMTAEFVYAWREGHTEYLGMEMQGETPAQTWYPAAGIRNTQDLMERLPGKYENPWNNE